MREMHIASQKHLIRSEVNQAVDYIHSMKNRTESRLRDAIKNRVTEAHAVADHLYRKYKSTRSPKEIAILITEALRPIRFNSDCGYFEYRWPKPDQPERPLRKIS